MPVENRQDTEGQEPDGSNAQDGDPTGSQGEQAPTGKTFTQDEVDKMISKRVTKADKATEKRVRQELADKLNGTTEAQPDATKTDGSLKGITDRLAALETEAGEAKAEAAFERSLRGLQLSDEQRNLLRPMFDPDNPDATKNLAAQLVPAGGSQTQAPGAGGSYQSPGGASGANAGDVETNPTKWSADHIAQLKRDGKFREALNASRSRGSADISFAKIRQP